MEQLQTAVKPIPPRQVNLLNIKQERQRGVGEDEGGGVRGR